MSVVNDSPVSPVNPMPVGGSSACPTVTPVVTASSAYAAGNLVGGLLLFAGAFNALSLAGILNSITVKCKSVQTAGFKLYVFSSNPTGTTWTDKATPALAAADVAKLVGVYTLGAADSGLGTHTVYNLDGISKSVASATTGLYAALVTTGTPTFASASDVLLEVGVLKD